MIFLGYFIRSYIIISCILTIYLITYEKEDDTEADFDYLQCKSFCNMLENKEIVNKLNNLQ